MLKECLEVFEDMSKESGGRIILDTYVPADGTYLIVDNTRSSVQVKCGNRKR